MTHHDLQDQSQCLTGSSSSCCSISCSRSSSCSSGSCWGGSCGGGSSNYVVVIEVASAVVAPLIAAVVVPVPAVGVG